MDTYPIPAPPPEISEIDERLELQNDLLFGIVEGLSGIIQEKERLRDNAVKALKRAVSSAIDKRLERSDNMIVGVLDGLTTVVDARLARQQEMTEELSRAAMTAGGQFALGGTITVERPPPGGQLSVDLGSCAVPSPGWKHEPMVSCITDRGRYGRCWTVLRYIGPGYHNGVYWVPHGSCDLWCGTNSIPPQWEIIWGPGEQTEAASAYQRCAPPGPPGAPPPPISPPQPPLPVPPALTPPEQEVCPPPCPPVVAGGESCDAPLYVQICEPEPVEIPEEECPVPGVAPPVEIAPPNDTDAILDEIRGKRRARKPDPHTPPLSECPPSEGDPKTCDFIGADVGSDIWLGRMATMAQGFRDLGRWLLTEQPISPVVQIQGFENSQIVTSIASILYEWRNSIGNTFIKPLRMLLVRWYSYAQTIANCDPCALLGIHFTKWMLSQLSKVELRVKLIAGISITLGVDPHRLYEILDSIEEYVCRTRRMTEPQIVHAWMEGDIDDFERFSKLMATHGINVDGWGDVIRAHGHHIEAHKLMEFMRRHKWTEEEIRDELKKRGWKDDAQLNRFIYLYDHLPSISDHLHWLRRGVFLVDNVRQFGLLEGFDQPAQVNEMLGLMAHEFGGGHAKPAFWTAFGADLRALGKRHIDAALDYAAHWTPPSPEQMREFVYRLRPGKAGVKNPVTTEDFKRILIESGYFIWARERFEETIYRPLAPTFLREIYYQRLIDDPEMHSRLQDIGYDSTTSDMLMGAQRGTRDRLRNALVRGYTPTVLRDAVRLNIMPRAEALARYERQGFRREEGQGSIEAGQVEARVALAKKAITTANSQLWRSIIDQYRVGMITFDEGVKVLTKANWTQEAAESILHTGDAQAVADLTKKGIQALRKAYMDGMVDQAGAVRALDAIGIVQPRVTEYIQEWELERVLAEPQATVAQLAKWVAQGLITVEAARLRLLRMGWRDPDLILILAEMASARLQRIAKLAKVAENDARRRAKLLEQELALMERDRRKIQAEVLRATPVSALKRRYCNGRISERFVRQRLAAGGYDPMGIQFHLDTWEDERRCRPETPPPETPELEEHRQREEERERKRRELEEQRRQREVMRATPISLIQRRYCDGRLSRQWVTERLAAGGYTPESIEFHLAAWEERRRCIPAP